MINDQGGLTKSLIPPPLKRTNLFNLVQSILYTLLYKCKLFGNLYKCKLIRCLYSYIGCNVDFTV